MAKVFGVEDTTALLVTATTEPADASALISMDEIAVCTVELTGAADEVTAGGKEEATPDAVEPEPEPPV